MKDNLKLDFIGRVENECGSGWSDVHYMHNGYGGWIELKAEDKFPDRIKFEPAQPNWLTKYWGAGGICYIFLKVKENNSIYIWDGKFARELNHKGGTKIIKPLFVAKDNPQGWGEIRELF